MSDSEAWLELCDIYLQEHEYDKAAFCMEELLLCKPYNHLVHQKYAEVSTRYHCWQFNEFLPVDSFHCVLLLVNLPLCFPSPSFGIYCVSFYCSRPFNCPLLKCT